MTMRNSQLITSGILVACGILLGRLSGFSREMVLANYLGASEHTDLIVVMLTTPELIINLLVGGAFSMVLIPEFQALPPHKAKALYQQFCTLAVLCFTLLTAGLAYFAEPLLSLLAPGMLLTPDMKQYFIIALIAIPGVGMLGITVAYMHYREKFILPSLATLLFNLGIIITLFLAISLPLIPSYQLLALGLVVTSVIRLIIFFIANNIIPWSFNTSLLNLPLLRRLMFCVMGLGMLFMIPAIVRAYASTMDAGYLTLTNYVIKLIELPLGVCISLISLLFLPKLTRLYKAQHDEQYVKLFKQLIIFNFVLSLAIVIPLSRYAPLITEYVFSWSALSETQISTITEDFSHYIWSLPSQGLCILLLSSFATKERTHLSFAITAISLLILLSSMPWILDFGINLFSMLTLFYALVAGSLLIFWIRPAAYRSFFDQAFIIDCIKLSVIAGSVFFTQTLLASASLSVVQLIIIIVFCVAGFFFVSYLWISSFKQFILDRG